MKKKMLSMILMIALIVSVMSVTALADGTNVAKIGATEYATLAEAIAAVKDGETITLLTDCSESVTITQKANVSFTIDGKDKTYTGTINVKGTGYADDQGQSLTIENVNFVMGGTYGIRAYTDKNTYPRSLTVENCTFTGKDATYKACYGIYLRHAYDIVVSNVEAEGVYDLVYGNTAVTGFTAENITVTDSTNGIWLSYVNSTADFDNIEMDVDEVGLGFYNNAKGTVTIDNTTINADSAVYLGQKNTTTQVTVNVNELGGESNLMVEVDSANNKYTVNMNDVNLEENSDGDYVYKKPVYIGTVEELEAFRAAVDGGNTFAGVTVYLTADIDLAELGVTGEGEPVSFKPIGTDNPFEGTFDGQGYTIKNMYQSGWAFGYEWGSYGSLGLFAEIKNATIKNLTIEGAELFVEGGDVAAITGSATGTCVFENITIKDSVMATYNNGCASIIAWSGAGNYTFKNITIEDDVVLAGLWGSFDSSIGGVVGQAEPGASYTFENVDIACRIDAYNDCTASYDYYNYRMCGMIMGRLEETTVIDGTNYPNTEAYEISFKDVNVTFGDWYDYHYCEPTPSDMNGGRGMRVEPGYAYDGLPEDYDHSQCVANHGNCIPFVQLLGGAQYAVKGMPYDKLLPELKAGVTVTYPAEKDHGLQEMVDAASDGDTIVLTEDLCEICGAIVNKSIVVNGKEGDVIAVDTDKAFVIGDNGSVSIIGGVYANEPEKNIADGYKVYDLKNGTWAVRKADTKVTVTFESDDKVVEEQTIEFAATATAVNVSRSGYKFLGWYLNDEAFDFAAPVTEDITLVAKWEEILIYVPTAPVKPVEKDDECDGTVADNCPAVLYSDLDTDAWYHEAIDFALSEGLMNGVGGGKFNPGGEFTRAMMWTVLARQAGVDTDGGATWYSEAQEWAIANDVSDGSDPNGAITREELVTMLWRYVGEPEGDADLSDFVDGNDVSEWAEDAMRWAVSIKVIGGRGNGILAPQGLATRAEVAQIFKNYFE